MVKTVRSDGTPSKAIPPLLNVHVYFAKACRCRVAIPQASKLTKTVASDGTPSKQPSSFRHVTSLDGRTHDFLPGGLVLLDADRCQDGKPAAAQKIAEDA